MIVNLRFPAYLVSEANKKDHRQVAATRTRKLREDLCLFLNTKRLPPLPVTVRLTRWSPDPQRLDKDNLARAFKAVQDEVAAKLGVNDNDTRVAFYYAQGRGDKHEVGIDVSAMTWAVSDTPEVTEVVVLASAARLAACGPAKLEPGVYDFGDLRIVVREGDGGFQ